MLSSGNGSRYVQMCTWVKQREGETSKMEKKEGKKRNGRCCWLDL